MRWRKELLANWERSGMEDRCESCGTAGSPHNPLTVMHALKQRFIRTREAYFRAALICTDEHNLQEYGSRDFTATHASMAAFVDRMIAKRLDSNRLIR